MGGGGPVPTPVKYTFELQLYSDRLLVQGLLVGVGETLVFSRMQIRASIVVNCIFGYILIHFFINFVFKFEMYITTELYIPNIIQS